VNYSRLVVVLVAQGCSLGVENVTDGYIRHEAIHIDRSLESQGMTSRVSAVNSSNTSIAAVVLPDAEVAVDETVVLLSG